ncbi:UNVERIFIED_CONTAM: hypothetical protein Sangu_1462300 [Sesamum angustifolium]|uniref:Uncharacterized protein n=1 Tax=Sesamum angustifolium TaxID=2727405 RepID=A0AAW2N928_9LAMI
MSQRGRDVQQRAVASRHCCIAFLARLKWAVARLGVAVFYGAVAAGVGLVNAWVKDSK